MKKTKSILAATLAATMLLSLTACGDNDDSKSSKKAKNESSSAEIADITTAYTEPMGTEPAIVNSIITEPVTEPETEPVTESSKFVPSASQQRDLDYYDAYALVDKDGKLVKYANVIQGGTLPSQSLCSDSISDTIVIQSGESAKVIFESNVDTDSSKIAKLPTCPSKYERICEYTAMVTDEDEINKYKTKYGFDGDVIVSRSYRYSDEKLKSILGEEAYIEDRYQAYNDVFDILTDADYMVTIIYNKENDEDFEKIGWGSNENENKFEWKERGLSIEDAKLEYDYFRNYELWCVY